MSTFSARERSAGRAGLGLTAGLLLLCAAARAQTIEPLPAQTQLVGVAGAPAATTETFTIAAPAESLVITLTDLQTPAALASATMVLTQGGSIVQIASGNAAASLAPPATTATLTIPGALGEYTLRVFGEPNADFSAGTFTVCVAPASNPSDCIQNASLAGNISTPASAADPTVSTLSLNLTVTTAATYTVTFADDQFPAALASAPNLALFQGSTVIATGIQSGSSFSLNPGTYTLLGVAQAASSTQAGLYGISIAGPGGSPSLLDQTFAVGALAAPSQPTNPTAQTLTLKVTDFAFPATLAGASALVTSGARVLGTTSASAGAKSFTAPAASLKVWSFATAGTDAGTYEVDLNSASANLSQGAFAVADGDSLAFAYVTSPLEAGSYQSTAQDFDVPAALSGLKFAVVQNDVVLKQSATAGTLAFTAAAGPVVVLANASIASGASGLFGINVATTAATPDVVFSQAQGVTLTGLFDSQTVDIGADVSGSFNVTLTDLQFPAQLQDLALVVSQGGTRLASAFGGGTLNVPATTGAYQLTFVATPASGQEYGMYSISMLYAAPTVTLTASPTSVTANDTTTLSWTTSGATSCTGSGGTFTGSQSTGSGSVAVVVAATTTYTLSCTGPGGSTSATATVTATAAASSSHGGGAIDVLDLGLLAAMLMWRQRRGRRSLDGG